MIKPRMNLVLQVSFYAILAALLQCVSLGQFGPSRGHFKSDQIEDHHHLREAHQGERAERIRPPLHKSLAIRGVNRPRKQWVRCEAV